MTQVGAGLARARERFLGDGVLSHADRVRPEILDSWRRSRSAGVDASRFHLPFESDIDLSGRLVACAAPVLDRLEEELSGSAVGVVLTDPDGRVLDRRVGEGVLRRRLDDISLAPGFSYAEEFAGTNGVGTALSGRAATLVVGPEHFTDRLQGFACAGAPVLHPVDGQLVGLVDVTCLRAEANDLIRVLALQAARDISDVLRERGSAGARALVAAFWDMCRRSDRPVLAVSEDFLIADREAQGVLTATDGDLLHRWADEWMRGPAAVASVDLAVGPTRVRTTPVLRHGRPHGVLVELLGVHPADAVPAREAGPLRGLPGLVGDSSSWRATCARLRAAARDRTTTVVLGEQGTGKWSAVRSAHGQMRSPTARWVGVDASSPGLADALRAVLDEWVPVTGDPDAPDAPDVTVAVRHLERISATDAAELASFVARVEAGEVPGCWVVGLVTGPPDRGDVGPVAGLPSTVVVTVAPLRHRPADVPLLVEALVRRHAAGRERRCTPAAVCVLTGARWPGNVTELAEAVRTALAARPTGDIEPHDLPRDLAGRARRRLSPLEALERDCIVSALEEAGGNRSRAAEALGIGRATLYRRLRAFGLQDVGR